MRKLLLLGALISVSASAQTLLYFSGFESGSASAAGCTLGSGASVQSSTVITGGWSAKLAATASGCATLFSATSDVAVTFKYATPTWPGGTVSIFLLTAPSSTNLLALGLKSNGALQVSGTAIGLSTPVSSGAGALTTTTAPASHSIQLLYRGAANGSVQVNVDGVNVITTTHPTVHTDVTGYTMTGFAPPNEAYIDDVAIWAHSSIVPMSMTLARQATSGTPTYDAWTKSSGTIDTVWADTPASATTNASSSTLDAAQTAVVAPFSATQTGHGTETVPSHYAVNGCKIGLIGKQASANHNIKIRRRAGSTDTDSALISLGSGTTDVWKDGGIFSATYADINAMEIGVVQQASGTLETVEDMWLLCSITPQNPPSTGHPRLIVVQ